MTTMKPNRTREQSVNNREVGNKDSGEQHLYQWTVLRKTRIVLIG